ncbi:43kDa postsynaptic protein [Trema orientale]|uniref:43kDa postsynaptic protein n=1 Tax=Trema orientale TaxID=63057 RepID=A0A2P5EG12_TREOI|nr:43kDa postsynaptic protein [Trema orientale]
MNGRDRSRRWSSIKQRLRLKGMGCCGATWGPSPSTLTIMETLQEDEEEEEHHQTERGSVGPSSVVVVGPVQSAATAVPAPIAGMNLAMALAAERNSRAGRLGGGGETVGPTTEVKSLMTLIEETDGVDWSNRRKRERDQKKGGGGTGAGAGAGGDGGDWLCCVCMERSKGAAFIPCGHTFCRVCSREMWLNRGSCPICNRPIVEILDIF